MEVNEGLLAFFAEEEGAVGVGVHALCARVGINQPQADHFLAPALEPVLPSIGVLTLAYGTGEAGARNDRESVTGAPWRGGNSLAVKLP